MSTDDKTPEHEDVMEVNAQLCVQIEMLKRGLRQAERHLRIWRDLALRERETTKKLHTDAAARKRASEATKA